MESLDVLNTRLVEHFGLDSDTSQPIFRIVWADTQTEKRLISVLDNGIELLFPEVREVKKYPYLKHMHVLEQLVVVPEINIKELPATKLSYEPLWGFADDKGKPMPPTWVAAKFVIDAMQAAKGVKGMAKYVDSEENTTPEGRESRITKLQKELFGNETDAADAMRYHEGVVVPHNYQKE